MKPNDQQASFILRSFILTNYTSIYTVFSFDLSSVSKYAILVRFYNLLIIKHLPCIDVLTASIRSYFRYETCLIELR